MCFLKLPGQNRTFALLNSPFKTDGFGRVFYHFSISVSTNQVKGGDIPKNRRSSFCTSGDLKPRKHPNFQKRLVHFSTYPLEEIMKRSVHQYRQSVQKNRFNSITVSNDSQMLPYLYVNTKLPNPGGYSRDHMERWLWYFRKNPG